PGEMPGETSDEVSDETFGAGAVAPREPAPPTVDALMTSFAALDALPQEAAPSVPGRDEAFVDDEAIEVVDAIDPDLFPIFEEEAEELLPQLQTRLRDWLAQPGDAAASSACMRTLHTFKGGARLAGAMRLGEMAHRLETAIEHLGASPAIGPERIEALLVRAENMREAFDALRGPQPASAPAPAAEPLPVALPLAISELQAELQAELQPGQLAEPSGDTQAGVEAAPVESLQARQAPRPAAEAAAGQGAAPEIDWSRFPSQGTVTAAAPAPAGDARPAGTSPAVRVRASLLDRMVNQAGEVSITRERIDSEMRQLQGAINDLTDNLERLRSQLRDIELQAETQIGSRIEAAKAASQDFDPLEMDRYTRFQELTRMMAESVNDVATVQRAVQRTLQSTEDQLAAQARLTRELQDDLLRTRMVEFESLADRLYRVVRQAAKDSGKQVRLDIVGGSIEVDRGVLDRMVGPFEHLLRNSVVHGIEDAARRSAAGKAPVGEIRITATQEGNEIGVECRDDGAGLDLAGIRARAVQRGLLAADEDASDAELAGMIFRPGFSTAGAVTELAGRGVGMDVVRAEVNAMGGRIETASTPGQGTSFRLVLPLTTAVTQVVLLRCDGLQVAVPSTLVEVVRRVPSDEVERAYSSGGLLFNEEVLPFFWLGALLQQGPRGTAPGRMQVVVIVRSAAQRVALHVDEVVGNQEVVVKHVGPQLARLPGLAGVTLLPSGAIALIYNPVALAALFGQEAQRRAMRAPVADAAPTPGEPVEQVPLVLVVDDSLTVRRVTQRLLAREGYRVVLAKDGLEAIERLAQERPAIMLTDIEMPRMDGFDLVRNVRADPALAGLPVVMITSRIAQKHRDYAAELGVDHYLGKPYGEEELLRLVAQYAGHPAAIA
ncbi:MAG: response regulator, partial [Burkholderiales bacterium]|nr:response regulator [Burkholderiales bacterium]